MMMRLMILFVGLLFTLSVAAKSQTSPSPKPKIPANCAVWFDGCNQCRVAVSHQSGQQMLACTRKFCPPKSLAPARCLQEKSDII